MMESLFGCNVASLAPKETTRRSVVPPVAENEKRLLDPKKSQNIAILLRTLNVTQDEVSEALLDGSAEGLGADLLETLVKMAPTMASSIQAAVATFMQPTKLGVSSRNFVQFRPSLAVPRASASSVGRVTCSLQSDLKDVANRCVEVTKLAGFALAASALFSETRR